jgi:lysophospholipase L1-like esterase
MIGIQGYEGIVHTGRGIAGGGGIVRIQSTLAPAIRSLAVLGGSIIDYTQELASNVTFFSNRGFSQWMADHLRQQLQLAYNPNSGSHEFGTFGYTSAQVLATHVPEVITVAPDAALIHTGGNDLANGSTGSTVWTGIQDIITALQAANIRCYVILPPPRDDAGYVARQATTNPIIAAGCVSMGVDYFDPNPYVQNSSNGYFLTGMASDGVHYSTLGAQTVGKALADWFRTKTQFDAAPFDSSLRSALKGGNPGFSGGTTTATGWTFTGTGTASKVAAADGGNPWQKIVHTPGARTDFFTLSYAAASLPGGLKPGDRVRLWLEAEFDSVGAAYTVQAKATFNGTLSPRGSGFGYGSTDPGAGAAVQLPSSGVYCSPYITIPADATTVAFEISVNGSCTVRFRDCGLELVSAYSRLSPGKFFNIHFGPSSTNVSKASGPANDPNFYWNNYNGSGALSPASISLIHAVTGSTISGKTCAKISTGQDENNLGDSTGSTFPGNATLGFWYGSDAATPMQVKLTGLDPYATYKAILTGSRAGVGDNRNTLYSITGLTTATGSVNCANNATLSATLTGLIPTMAGELTLTVTKGTGNTNGTGLFYLGMLKLEIQ